MKLRLTHLLALAILTSISSPSISTAQNDNNEEVFQLSPFTVDASPDTAWKSRSHSKTRINTKTDSDTQTSPTMTVSGATIEGIEIGDYSQFSHPSSIRIRFAVGFYDDEEKVRRDTLNRYLDEIAATLVSKQGLSFEAGAILVPEGDKGWSRTKSRSDFASLAHFTVSFATNQTESPFEKVRAIRRFIGEIKLDSKYAKVFYGEANLLKSYSNQPYGMADLGTTISGIEIAANNTQSIAQPDVPIFLIKKADFVRLNASVSFQASNREEAVEYLNEFLKSISSQTISPNTMAYHNQTRVSREDDINHLGKRVASFKAHTQVSILIKIDDLVSPRTLISEIKHSIIAHESTQKASQLEFGIPRLVINNPDEHRSEILEKIASDIQNIDNTLGEDFTVELLLNSSRVQTWQHSDTEVQLWIPYSQNIVSNRIRKREELQQTRAHEIAMKDTRPQIVCCRDNSSKD